MTKPMNTIDRKTERCKGALNRILHNDFKPAYFCRDKEVKTLQERIANAPEGKVSTKKNRSNKQQGDSL